jgi:hypothetical protein
MTDPTPARDLLERAAYFMAGAVLATTLMVWWQP